jgi:glycosyltransferase involved in cell wall biosynthesis
MSTIQRSMATNAVDCPRVLHIFNRYRFYGGEEAAVERISQVMREQGAVFEECFAASEDWEREGRPSRLKQALLSIYNPESLARVREAHERLGANVWLIHNVYPVLSLAVFREAHRLGVPVVFYLHNYSPYSTNGLLWADDRLMPDGLNRSFIPEIRARAWQGSLLRTSWKALALVLARGLGWYRKIAAWVAVSSFVRDRFVEAGVERDRVHVLAYPYLPGNQLLKEPPQGAGFLFLGRLSVAKGTRVLLEAWAKLIKELGPQNAPKLTLAGDGELREEVGAAAAASGGCIRYVGQVSGEEKQRLIQESLAFVVPSVWWDPYPTVVYEAFDAGRPVLAANSGGLPESVTDRVSGRLHSPGDAETLARQVMELAVDRDGALKMGRAGREWLLARAGGERWWLEFQEVLRRAVGRRE